MDPNGGNQTRVTNNADRDADPAWSPDGARIAFSSDRDGNSEVYVMNTDGSGQARLTTNPASDSEPAWSPDGTKIVFATDRDGSYEIYKMNSDGSGQTNVTLHAGDDRGPAWSPDSSRLTFYSNRDGNVEIYKMNADGSGQANLTNDPAHDSIPGWSPDGTMIAFRSLRDDPNPCFFTPPCNFEIYVMDVDGAGQTRLTNNPADDSGANWQPLFPVGGIAELPEISPAPLEATTSSARHVGHLVGAAAAFSALAIAFVVAARHVRRRGPVSG